MDKSNEEHTSLVLKTSKDYSQVKMDEYIASPGEYDVSNVDSDEEKKKKMCDIHMNNDVTNYETKEEKKEKRKERKENNNYWTTAFS
eukprot:994294-Ditylum_brightwellii.AAC.1